MVVVKVTSGDGVGLSLVGWTRSSGEIRCAKAEPGTRADV